MDRVITFYSSHLAIKAEKLLNKNGITVRMIPVPRHISSNCGVAIGFERNLEDMVVEHLTRAKIEMEGVYDM